MRNPLTLEAFAEWCEKQPKRREYDYTDNCGCAFFRYLESCGFNVFSVGPNSWTELVGDDIRSRALPARVDDSVSDFPRTYGALAKRLRESV